MRERSRRFRCDERSGDSASRDVPPPRRVFDVAGFLPRGHASDLRNEHRPSATPTRRGDAAARALDCSTARSRSLTVAALVVWVIAMFLLVGNARAEETAAAYIQPRVSRQHFDAFCRKLELQSDQTMIADLLYHEYADGIGALIRRTDDEADKAGRQRVHDALTGRAIVPPDELRAIRARVLETYAVSLPEAESLMQQLLDDIQMVLQTEQLPRISPALRDLRRQVLLHPRQVDSRTPGYAGDGVDVIELARQAGEGGGELSGVNQDVLERTLAIYENALDRVVLDITSADQRGRIDTRIAEIRNDREAVKALQEQAIARWQRLYDLNRRTIDAIGELAAQSNGVEARTRWEERFDRASFGWLFERHKPDRQYAWIIKQDLPPEVMDKARQAYRRYQAKRSLLNQRAIGIMIRGRVESQIMLHSRMDPSGLGDSAGRGLYQQLLKNSGELSSLENDTSAALESLLTPSQRQKMRRALRRG